MWPGSFPELIEQQVMLAALEPAPWRPEPHARLRVGGCFVCFPRGHEGTGARGDPAWAGAAVLVGKRPESSAEVTGVAGGPYEPGLLAAREGAVLAEAVRKLPARPDVLLVNATGRDHPRGAGLALHLGVELDIPSVGVTHRSFLATGEWPGDVVGAASPLVVDGNVVGAWVRTRAGRRPVAVHAAWRTDPEVAVDVVRRCGGRHRTPAPLREARRLARSARTGR